jgi:hypothetical protein
MNREGWLTEAMRALRPIVKRQGLSVPKGTRISCSWPADHGTSRKVRKDAETWFFKNGAPEISISPTLGQDDVEVLGTVLHEMIHAAIGGEFDHRHKEFRHPCFAMGLVGKPSATGVGPELRKRLTKISKQLGPYPHTGVTV